MNYYEAKFQREKKPIPKDWVVVPGGLRGEFSLLHLPCLPFKKSSRVKK